MGEPIVAASNDEDKMGETAASHPALEMSVSFGRFENDSLSWEKWSSFSPNKYLEEVEKCATPGSVAQKKAYFEAHYKKIAAKKAVLLDQERQVEHDSLKSNYQNSKTLTGQSCWTDSEFDVPNSQTYAEEVREETKLDGELGNGLADELNEDAAVSIEGQWSSLGVKELDSRSDGPMLDKPEQAAFVKEEEPPSMSPQDMKELPKNLEKEVEGIPIIKEENVKLDHRKQSNKIIQINKVGDMARAKKKPVSLVTKAPQTSTLKVSKPVSTSATLYASQSSTKKPIGSSLPRSKIPSVRESKKVAPKSLHMSLSLDPPNCDPAPLTTTRKSFIMEQMRDKDIVKRAFKTFQNNFNQLKSSAEVRSSEAKQVPAKGTGLKISTSLTTHKENGGSLKAGGMDKKTAKAAPSSLGLRSDERAERKKEFPKKFGEKPIAKEAKSTPLGTKSKEEKEAENRKLRQSLNFKATPMPSSFRGHKLSKSHLNKQEGSKSLRI